MCISFFTEATILTRDLLAYKIVRRESSGAYISEFYPDARTKQGSKFGSTLTYTPGKTTYADEDSPGIYLYPSLCNARDHLCAYWGLDSSSHTILQVRIPAGTPVRFGLSGLNMVALCTPRVEVLRKADITML